MKLTNPANQKNPNNLFLTLVIRNIHYFILFLLLVYGMSAIVVKGSGMISAAIDDMLNEKQVDIAGLVLWTLVLVAISMVLAFVKQICGELFSIKIQKACKNKTAEHLADLEYSYFTGQTGAVINKLTSDIGDVGSLLSEVLPEVMQSAVAIITYCIAIYQMDFRLLLGILICYPVVLAISSFIAKKLVALAKKRRGKYDLLAEVTADSLSGIVVERAYGLYDILSEKTNGVVKDILKNEFVRNRYQSISTAIQTFVKWLPTVICAVIALFEVLSGRITVGTLMAFMVLFIKLSDPMSSLPFRINDGREFMVSLRRINEIMRTPAEP